MTYPTPEEINQIAEECGLCDSVPVLYTEELQAFFLRGIEMGRKMQMESDIDACKEFYSVDGTAQKCVASIRNNTGE